MDQETRQQTIKLFDIQNLSEHYQDAAVAYLMLARHNTDLLIKEIDNSFRNTLQSRLLESSYSQEDVTNVINTLQTMVLGTLRIETQNSLYSGVELLKQVFTEADNCGLKLDFDLSSLENEESINRITRLEQKLAPRAAAKLPSLGTNALQSYEDALDLREQNAQLKKKVSKIQSNFTAMMKEKTSITESMNTMREELKKLSLEKHNMEERAGMSSDAASRFKNISSDLESQRSHLEQQQHNTEKEKSQIMSERSELKQQIQSLREELQRSKEELSAKVSETTQFKNMRQMLQSKNQQIKELRNQLNQSTEASEPTDF